MPRAQTPEFRQPAVELAWMREMPIAQIVSEVGISDSCLRGWVAQADRDEGRRSDGLSTAERRGLLHGSMTTEPTVSARFEIIPDELVEGRPTAPFNQLEVLRTSRNPATTSRRCRPDGREPG